MTKSQIFALSPWERRQAIIKMVREYPNKYRALLDYVRNVFGYVNYDQTDLEKLCCVPPGTFNWTMSGNYSTVYFVQLLTRYINDSVDYELEWKYAQEVETARDAAIEKFLKGE